MSYILDALRRADAERERGAVPGLHAQALPAAGDDGAAGSTQGWPAWAWFASGMAIVALAGFGWQWWAHDSNEQLVVAAMGTAPVSVAGMAPASAAAPPQAATAMPPTAKAIDDRAAPAPAVQPAARAPEKPARRSESKPAGQARSDKSPSRQHATRVAQARDAATGVNPQEGRAGVREAAGKAGGKAGGETASKTAGDADSAAPRIYKVAELPNDIQRELPKLTVGGSIYSPSPASRFLIINGRIFHEHDKVTPDLTLEEIQLKAAVLDFKGYRYGITF